MPETAFTSLLLWSDVAAGPLVVTTGGQAQDRLADAAARACRASDKASEFTPQFHRLVTALHGWLDGHREKINSAYLAVREQDLLFLVVQKNARFDADLSDSLTDLDLLVANSGDLTLVDLEVMAVPPLSTESLKSMLSSGTVVYDAK